MVGPHGERRLHRRTTLRSAAACFLAAFFTAGCTDRVQENPVRIDQLATRLDKIEQRLARAEEGRESIARLRDDVRNLEQRVAEAEAQAMKARIVARSAVREGALQPPDYAEIQALHQDFLERRAHLEEEYRDALGSPEYQEALQDLNRWHLERKRDLSEAQWEEAQNK